MIKKYLLNIYVIFFWILLLSYLTIIYSTSFNNFFFGDDFFNLSLSKANSLKEVINFFNIFKAPLNFPFYRPLTTQLYFWFGYNIFKLNPLGFHLMNYFVFVGTLFLIYHLAKKITKNLFLTLLTTFFYSLSASHFYRLYFISQFQEIGLTFFYLLTLSLYIKYLESKKIKYYLLSFFTFIITLSTKETVITLPIVMILLDFCFYKNQDTLINWIKKRKKIFLSFIIIVLIYIIWRIGLFGFSQGENYQFILKPKSILNNLLWYFLWSVGIPEQFVNIKIFDPNYLLNPNYLVNFGRLGSITTLLYVVFFINILLGIKLLILNSNGIKKNILKLLLFSLAWFFATLILVSFFPFHKFSYSVTLPLFGVSIITALFIKEIINFSKFFFVLSISLYMLANLSTINLELNTHWAIKRAVIAKNFVTYFQNKHQCMTDKNSLYFYDYNYCSLSSKNYNFSEELSYALSNEKTINFFYQKNIPVYFQSYTPLEELDMQNIILIDSKQFFINNDE